MTISPSLLQEVGKVLITASVRAWELSGNTGDALIPKIHELQDFTLPQEASDWAVIVSKSGDRYYVISYEDTLLFSLERTQELNELRANPNKQWDIMRMATIQQMASLMLFTQDMPHQNALTHETQKNLIDTFMQTLETSTRDLEEPRPFIPPEHRQDFEQQVQSGLQQLRLMSEHHAEALAGYWSGELSADQLNAIANFMIKTKGEPTPERLLWLIKTWAKTPDLPNPVIPLIQAWQKEEKRKKCRTIGQATVDHVQQTTRQPYAVSEVNRRRWKSIQGSVNAIEVDGEPIVTRVKNLPGDHRAFKTIGTTGELMPMPIQRDNMETPVVLMAYQQYGDNLRKATAPDTAQLLGLAHITNEPIILSINDGARLLARDQNGNPRRPRAADEARFEIAFACIDGMSTWIVDQRNIPRYYPLTACNRYANNTVSIDAAAWAKDPKAGRWTLTAGLGIGGLNRLKGNVHNNNILRVITGIEYWLAREAPAWTGTSARISKALIPEGKTGAGTWRTLHWRDFMTIGGDLWDKTDKMADNRAYKRFYKIRNALIAAGYQIQSLSQPALAGDTVEFLFSKTKNGQVKVRATARFIEAARKADRKEWETVSLTNFLGW